MARGVINSIIGSRWARRGLWVFLVWLALNITVLSGMMNAKVLGFNAFLAWVYGGLLLLIAWDVYHNAI